MASAALTAHDLHILEKIKDPEGVLSAPLLIDDSLPKDPQITDDALYQRIAISERSIISSIQEIEFQIAGLRPAVSGSSLSNFHSCIERLDDLIQTHPTYASARNNRAQAIRRVYGDGVVITGGTAMASDHEPPLDTEPSECSLLSASRTILNDLTTAITLLTPLTPFSPVSTQAAKTLSQAYTQRGAIYHMTAKHFSRQGTALRIDANRKEAKWRKEDFEENASRDFFLGGRYGNEVARALAVSTNPTAKLCNAIVSEAMRKEYAGAV